MTKLEEEFGRCGFEINYDKHSIWSLQTPQKTLKWTTTQWNKQMTISTLSNFTKTGSDETIIINKIMEVKSIKNSYTQLCGATFVAGGYYLSQTDKRKPRYEDRVGETAGRDLIGLSARVLTKLETNWILQLQIDLIMWRNRE